tara:strand:+ start:32 stop:211 length:180 start_codon:yes stop_codon:yes gene_type:complete
MLEYSDIRRRRHKFYWVISFGFAYFIVNGIWKTLVFIFKNIHKLAGLALNGILKAVKRV